MNGFPLTLVAFIFALGVLIVVHELGHYWVARWCGVKVLRFSVGFGRTIWMRRGRHDDTEWAVAAIPFGGYVKMLDEREIEGARLPESEALRAFNRQSVGKRMAIVAAGPVANFLLAVALYFTVNVLGVDEPAARIDAPPAATLAARSGFLEGDRIVAADGETVRSWLDLRWRLVKAATDRRAVSIDVTGAMGAQRSLTLDLTQAKPSDIEGDFLRRLGLGLAPALPVVGRVLPGSPAEAAGLKPQDRVLKVGGARVRSARDVIGHIHASRGRPLAFEIDRAGTVMQIEITPRAQSAQGEAAGDWKVGAELGAPPEMVRVTYGVGDGFTHAAGQTADMAWFSLRMLGKMIVGEVSFKNLSGPVTIADYAGQSARLGLATYLGFMALISVSLGVLNLLPIPVLDGGHLLYYLLELLRGSPLPEKWLEIGQRAGLGLLFVLMAIALFNDFSRLLS